MQQSARILWGTRMTMSMPSVLRPVAASAPGIRVAGASAAADFAPLVGSFECEGGPMFTLSQDACDQSGLGPATLTNLLPVEDGFIITSRTVAVSGSGGKVQILFSGCLPPQATRFSAARRTDCSDAPAPFGFYGSQEAWGRHVGWCPLCQTSDHAAPAVDRSGAGYPNASTRRSSTASPTPAGRLAIRLEQPVAAFLAGQQDADRSAPVA